MGFRPAFMVLAHSAGDQLNRLIGALLRCEADVFVHVDAKSDAVFLAVSQRFGNNAQVHILRDRVRVNRGGYSVVEATLRLMRCVKLTGTQYSHVTLLSGQDYPIKSPEAIRAFLERHHGRQFFDAHEIGALYWRIKCFNFFGEHPANRSFRIRLADNALRRIQQLFVRRSNLPGLTLYKGSQWFTVTGDCLDSIVDFVDANPWYIEGFRYTYVPDESFIQTIVLNGPFRDSVANANLTHIDWVGGVKGSPKTLTEADLPSLARSPSLFARKFDERVHPGVLAQIDGGLLLTLPAGHVHGSPYGSSLG